MLLDRDDRRLIFTTLFGMFPPEKYIIYNTIIFIEQAYGQIYP